jgi:hypothetical protein
MLGEEIRTQYRFVNGGLDEWDVWEVAAAEGNGFVDFSPGFDTGTISAGESRAVCCG